MHDLGVERTDQSNLTQLDRRRLLRTAGLGFGLGAAGLLSEDADAKRRRPGRPRHPGRPDGWLNIEFKLYYWPGSEGGKPPIGVEAWSSGDTERWTRYYQDSIPPRQERTYRLGDHFAAVGIDGQFFVGLNNPWFGTPSAAVAVGGTIDAKGWHGGKVMDFAEIPENSVKQFARMQIPNDLVLYVFRKNDTNEAKVFWIDIFPKKDDTRPW